MPYFYEKNDRIYATNSIDELIHHSFPIDVKSPEKIAHYMAVAQVIFSSQYKLSLSTTREDIILGQDFIDFIDTILEQCDINTRKLLQTGQSGYNQVSKPKQCLN